MSTKRQPNILNPRASAAKILQSVVYKGESLSTALVDSESPLVSDFCYGSLRWHESISALLDQLLKKPIRNKDKDVECLIRVGLYQIVYQKTPDHAAVAETVGALKDLKKPWAKKLVNGVLRNFIREQENIKLAIEKNPEAKYAFPQWLIDEIKKAWPKNWEAILEKSNQRAPMILRVNLRQTSRDNYLKKLDNVGISASKIESVASAIKLDKPCNVYDLPGFETGSISVQDASAQLAGFLLGVESGMCVLDACAAPGGKTGHILEQADNLSLLAIDNNNGRLERVKENLQRIGLKADLHLSDALQTENYAKNRLFDRILLDAPCSATGVIRRHPDIKVLRRKSDIVELQQLQAKMLDAMWKILKHNGELLYATCSILPQENEQQIQAFFKRHRDVEILNIDNAQTYGYQMFPGDNDGDGFYYARLKKIQ